MSYSLNGSSKDPRVDALREQHRQRQNRLFITFALVEGLLVVAAVLVIFVLGIVDVDQGIWILVAIAAIGGLVLSFSLLTMVRRHAHEMRELTGN
ncbi:hypothetical protein [Microbacterium sp. A93]|uniref:hypothetical protein n=1 Tax=unclassified Microbacterium TaxID=2609290 RepID=UPI003F4235BA